jgi:hypothetical protein
LRRRMRCIWSKTQDDWMQSANLSITQRQPNADSIKFDPFA